MTYAENGDYWRMKSNSDWEIKQVELAIAYYSDFANSTTDCEEKYELDSILRRLGQELDDLKCKTMTA